MHGQGKDAGGAQYVLVGLVEHQGSMAGGHYISYSARLPGWQPACPAVPAEEAPEPKLGAAAASAALAADSPGKKPRKAAVPNGHASTAGSKDAAKAAQNEALKEATAELRGRMAASRERIDAGALCWFRASDTHVKRVCWDDVASCEPYILIYVRTQ